MKELLSDLVCRVLSVAAVLTSFIIPASSIDCYKCASINGRNKDCEDVFDLSINTVHLIQRKCIYGFFEGTHCIKLKGEREDGTDIVVRDCSNADWGSHCGDIRYLHGDKEERIKGCLEACDHDGCNRATAHAPSLFFILLLPVVIILRFLVGELFDAPEA